MGLVLQDRTFLGEGVLFLGEDSHLYVRYTVNKVAGSDWATCDGRLGGGWLPAIEAVENNHLNHSYMENPFMGIDNGLCIKYGVSEVIF